MAQIEQTRAVVEADETFDGKIIPTVQAELDRPVRIHDNATVQGSVYGESVEIYPDSTIEGSVMASQAVEMEGGHIHGEVGTPGKVVASDAYIEGTITGKLVHLTDCVVRGNVVGSKIILEDCDILGIVTADQSLTIENSLCYTFRGHGETTLARTITILPQAICDGPVQLETPVSVAGLGRLELTVDDEGDENNADGRLPEMTEADFYQHQGTRYLTLAPRVLNLEKVSDHLNELERGVMTTVDDASSNNDTTMDVADVLSMLDVDAEAADIAN